MPNVPSIAIPADAFAKADEKVKGGTDYYADLTDEERIEEGLPPREEAKPEPTPAATPAADPEDEPEPDDEDATERLFEEIAGLREDIGAAIGKPEPAPTKKDEDPLLQAALESGDESIQYLAQRLQQANERLEKIEAEAREERTNRQTARDDADFDAVQASYTIGGKPMTDEQVEKVEKFILKNPDVGRHLSIEQLTRVVFPDATRVGKKSPPAKGPGASATEDGSPVATIVDVGATGGGAANGAWKPGPNETIESAMKAYAATRGLKR